MLDNIHFFLTILTKKKRFVSLMLHKKKETEVFYFYGHRKVTVNKTPIHSDL